jgi:hypothetical protein
LGLSRTELKDQTNAIDETMRSLDDIMCHNQNNSGDANKPATLTVQRKLVLSKKQVLSTSQAGSTNILSMAGIKGGTKTPRF